MKLCVVTGSRADYGLLYWLMRDIQADPDCRLQVAVTGMHLAPEFGHTWRVLEQDGFAIDARVETVLSSDTPAGVAKSMGLGLIGFADAFARLAPDWVVLLGDRYEIHAAAQAAYVARIPIAHIAGGDITAGAFDEAFRHGITKMAQLHFVTHRDAARRVRQLGEAESAIFDVGSPGIDTIRRMQLLGRDELEASLGIRLAARNLLVTFHPVTLSDQPAEAQLDELLAALRVFMAEGDTRVILTRPNADSGSRSILQRLDAFAAESDAVSVFTSLGQARYLSLMALANAVVGNSSSGLYEAPTLKKPTVNIGERQLGRPAASSVVHCPTRAEAIVAAIRAALALDCSEVVNPYGDGHAAERILAQLKAAPRRGEMMMKRFRDL